ncbi:hypothetical protein Catovirus_1_791 [Catovirus CTV1]|uniref:Uncharacterized protein n=1 Tax=Catovirus CTV1 TaxID=1977631 RepID=A0A1V0SAM3_9VIRU|nr:hypothetical protein Catovirus_1_791 [Catovirus CTV1]
MILDNKKYNIDEQCFECVELLDKDYKFESYDNSEENIFRSGIGRPSQSIDSYDDFVDVFLDGIEGFSDDDDSGITSELVKNITTEKLKTRLKGEIKYIYTNIDYPLTYPSIFKFTCKIPVTYGLLLYAYTVAYQLTYIIEEEEDDDPGHIPGMLNRAISKGRFGIWGHDIDDLVYNGYSDITYDTNSVVCEFYCDS